MIPFPNKQYDIIYADPPWEGGGKHSSRMGPHLHYPVMEYDEICALPVPNIVAEDCLLFMWTTSPELDQAIDVGKHWGFE